MNNEIWLSIEEVSALTEEIKETVRRKCKREEYVSTFTKNSASHSVLLPKLSSISHLIYSLALSWLTVTVWLGVLQPL